jgi:tetratricopeptide (TPR) repeat protein
MDDPADKRQAAERRNRDALERAVDAALTNSEMSLARYNLALFHDNNSREAEAIPHYEAALELGLSGPLRARCLAFLASSLMKTGREQEAHGRAQEAAELADEPDLMRFIAGLMKRIRLRLAALGQGNLPN